MAIFAISFVLLVLAMLGMAIGVLFGRPPIRGTCGGLNNHARSNVDCLVCCDGCDNNTRGRDRAAALRRLTCSRE